jgi:putative flavoprotein involved in K+ transport
VRSREVHLAIGGQQPPMPQRLLGRDVFDYLERLGLMTKTADSRLGQRLKARETLVGLSPRRAGKQGISLRPRVIGAEAATLSFADGTRQETGAVIWATGFRLDHAIVQLPVFDADGQLAHRRA